MTQAPAGWYPQPDGTQRYWDGSAWTEHTAPGAALATPPAPPAAPVVAVPPAPPVATEPPAPPAPPAPPVEAAPPAPPALAAPPAPPSQQVAYAAIPSAAAVVKPRKRVWPWVLGIGGGILVVVIA